MKRTSDNPGGIMSVESPLHYSNVMLIDPVTKGPVRSMYRYLEDGTKVRISKGKLASGSIIPRPEILKERRKPRPVTAGPYDTLETDVSAATHTPGDLPTALKVYLQKNKLEGVPMRFAAKRTSALYGKAAQRVNSKNSQQRSSFSTPAVVGRGVPLGRRRKNDPIVSLTRSFASSCCL